RQRRDRTGRAAHRDGGAGLEMAAVEVAGGDRPQPWGDAGRRYVPNRLAVRCNRSGRRSRLCEPQTAQLLVDVAAAPIEARHDLLAQIAALAEGVVRLKLPGLVEQVLLADVRPVPGQSRLDAQDFEG